jgi:iron complex outermembrane recepter protein
MRKGRLPTLVGLLVLVCFAPQLPGSMVLAADATPPADLTEMSLEDLMSLEVTSVARKPQTIGEASAAVFVITQEDIRRAGATSIPEALRLAPGLEVARIDASKWAITARGFNGRFANKLLVLIDGRTVYTPWFSGVYWDVQDTLLEDVDRIEVIRGPGASVWGANAVNGVINIITRPASETQGMLVTALGGSEDRFITGVRSGGTAGARGHYRIYAKSFDRDPSLDAAGARSHDASDLLRGGLRADWNLRSSTSLMVEGDWYGGDEETVQPQPLLSAPFERTLQGNERVKGSSLLARWRRAPSSASDLTVQLYGDLTRRDTRLEGDPDRFGQRRAIYDLDVQQRNRFGRQEAIWGFGYRTTDDRFDPGSTALMDPERRTDTLWGVFAQDDVDLAGGRGRLTVGSKLEHNDYTGAEVQPTARLFWRAGAHQSVWTAVSRAVRTPSRAESDARLNLAAFDDGMGGAVLVSLFGNPQVQSEELRAHEIGWRLRPNDRVSLDLAAFYNVYDRLLTLETGSPVPEAIPAPPHLLQPRTVANNLDGSSCGVEIATTLRVSERWHLSGWYTYLNLKLRPEADSTDPGAADAEGNSPRHQAQIHASVDLPARLELDGLATYVGRLESQNVPDYVRLDLHLIWKPRAGVEASIGLQNLLDRRHPEYGSDFVTLPAEIERSVYGAIRWRF